MAVKNRYTQKVKVRLYGMIVEKKSIVMRNPISQGHTNTTPPFVLMPMTLE